MFMNFIIRGCIIISIIIVIFRIGRDFIQEKAILKGMNEKEAREYYKFKNIFKRINSDEENNDNE